MDGPPNLNARTLSAAGFDFIIVVLTIIGVRKYDGGNLASLLRRQGIGYFGLILIVHTVTVVGTIHPVIEGPILRYRRRWFSTIRTVRVGGMCYPGVV